MRFLKATLCASLALPAAVGLAQSDFGKARLAEGKEAFIQKRYSEAVEDFRVAGFALLDHPPQLIECLVRQAVAQSAGGYSDEDRKATVNRFLETERRFPLFRELDLEPEIRRTFETILRRDVPPEVLASMPELEMTPASTAGKQMGAKTPVASVPLAPSTTAAMRMVSTPRPTERTPEPETGRASTVPPTRGPEARSAAASVAPPSSPSAIRGETSSPTSTVSRSSTPIPLPSDSPTPIQTATERPSPTATPSPSATEVPSATHTARPTETSTETSTPTSTRTSTPTPRTPSPTTTPSDSPTRTETATSRPTATPSQTATPRPTSSATPSATQTSVPPTATHVPTLTSTSTPRSSATRTPYPASPTPLPTWTPLLPKGQRTPRTPTPGSSAMPSPSAAAPARAPDRPPKPIFTPGPIYPREDLNARIRGVVSLNVLVSRSGDPQDIVVLKSARGHLTEAAIQAVLTWRFEPAVKDGRPVDAWTVVEIPFEAIPYPTVIPPSATLTPSAAKG